MLLSDFITVALIPSLIHTSSEGEATSVNSDHGQREQGRAAINSRSLPLPRSSEEGDIFGNEDFFNQSPYSSEQRPIVRDPILRDIYEEQKRLNLADGDFDMRSEEARELINFQRRKVNMMQKFARQAGAVIGIRSPQTEPQGRSLFFGPTTNEGDTVHSSTEFPILISSPPPSPEEPTTTVKTATGRLGIGGMFSKVHTGVVSTFGKIFGGGSATTSTPPPSSNNNVHFPDDDKPTPRPPQKPETGPSPIVFGDNLNCNGTKTEYNGECYNVLQQLPCPAGQWLIEDDNTGKGRCVENKCASVPNTAFFGGKCVTVRSEGDHCHNGMVTYIFKNGEVECDCKDEYLYNQRDGNCYPAYRRGPCNVGELFVTKITKIGALPASCIRNKCSKDGYFCNAPSCPNDRNCIALKSDCPNGQWDIHPEKLAPACIDFNIHKPGRIIGNVPTLACAPGSRRDILGTCRKPSRISFS